MKFSICIPNYNYEKYLGRTLRSALDQTHRDLEVLVSDNASTDASLEVIRASADDRVQVRVNRCNVGFSGNLDRAARMATGDVMIMLSSDDVMRPDALATYSRALDAMGSARTGAILSASCDVIDPDDRLTGRIGPPGTLWTAADRDAAMEAALGVPVYSVECKELLRRALRQMLNPFNFMATAYPRSLYDSVEGYAGGRLINPDRWFHWRLLAVGTRAYFIDAPLFAYRVHPNNQTSQQSGTGALKYLVDEYVSTIELDGRVLEQIGVTRDEVIRAFVDHDIGGHGLSTLAHGERVRARRILSFGLAAYPQVAVRRPRFWALASLVALGPVGEHIARTMKNRIGGRTTAPASSE